MEGLVQRLCADDGALPGAERAQARTYPAQATYQGSSQEAEVQHPPVISRYLDQAFGWAASHGFDDIVDPLEQIKAQIPWTPGYSDPELGEAFAENFAYAEIVGPGGLLRTNDYSAGLTLFAPGTLYEWHNHPAVELYLVLCQGSTWALHQPPFEAKAPGEVVLHPSNAEHAMTSGDQPFLAPWLWLGDVQSAAQFTRDEKGIRSI
ncbi:dimethylsulfonioproprionate lyase family protein [Henriciella aquimarina]|uniref:dimethylsulfonioproprionate lyase family protein n=1 Tax=Henriciella aquimarina TaxID=545261 RepID=UPI00130200EE|nr:dimethylsulfonioproprionate lyase family protein [Henriciella aquimarina]